MGGEPACGAWHKFGFATTRKTDLVALEYVEAMCAELKYCLHSPQWVLTQSHSVWNHSTQWAHTVTQ